MTSSPPPVDSLPDAALGLALAPVNHLINSFIAGDEHIAGQVSRFNGKSLAIITSRPTLKLLMGFHNGAVSVSTLKEQEADAQIEAPMQHLLSLLTADPEKPRPLADPAISISGDILFVQQLQQTVQTLDIDWLDDIGSAGARIHSIADDSRESVQRNLRDYLTEERRCAVARAELPPLTQRIESLGLRIDRAEARIRLLQATHFD